MIVFMDPASPGKDDNVITTKFRTLGKAVTVGELKKLLDSYPDETSFGFRNQPLQELYEVVMNGETFVVFDHGIF